MTDGILQKDDAVSLIDDKIIHIVTVTINRYIWGELRKNEVIWI